MKTRGAVPLFLLLVPSIFYGQGKDASATVSVAEQRPEEVRNRYHVVQVDPVTIHEGVEFPAEYLPRVQAEIEKELSREHLFEEVVGSEQGPTKTGQPTLRVAEEITSYEPGSRAKRYLGSGPAGGGPGSAAVTARIVFLDGDSSRVFMTENLRAILSGGLFGGNAEGVVKDFARQIVTKTKLMLVIRLPEPEEAGRATEAGKNSEGASGSEPGRHMIDLAGPHWNDVETRLNEDGVSGFRVTGLNLTGKNKVQAILEKLDSSSGHYEYRLLHGARSNLEKDMNRASSEGFRMAKGTVALVGATISVIMEKPPDPPNEHYEYLLSNASRISSSQKDTEKAQAEGYTLVGEADGYISRLGMEIPAGVVLIFEKTTDSKK